ncbi:MAG: DUF177 domain-containing protein [Ideonella sp.]|nr:DUF177 domain-containing protein [Ideonella sp.]MCC7456918.1 DUF177 domain-containing protein [Nitrospira sp.]
MRRHEPEQTASHLDVAKLAAEGASLNGQWAVADLPRWHAAQTSTIAPDAAAVRWQVDGETRRVAGQAPQIWLRLQAQAQAGLTCQRCLQPFGPLLQVDRWVRFVAGEQEAEALDADSDDDVLALEPALDLRILVEDELLLACPIVPRHDDCRPPAHRAGDEAEAAADNPFAALAALKAGPAQH